jgi:DNA-binding winged helix-turn-helix (wHTH) protein
VVRAEAPPSVRPVSPPDAVRVRVIDGLSVEGFAEHQLGSRKARLALRMLGIAQGRPVSIERLADALWLEDQPRDPPAQLAVIMSRLRGVLGGSRISHSDAGYALHADWIDLAAASELQSEADRRLRENEPAPALAAATAARALLAHPALEDEACPRRIVAPSSGSVPEPDTWSRAPRSRPATLRQAWRQPSRPSTRMSTTRSHCGW